LLARVTGSDEGMSDAPLALTLPHSLREGATIAAISNRNDTAAPQTNTRFHLAS
jgi:hypothetical protein